MEEERRQQARVRVMRKTVALVTRRCLEYGARAVVEEGASEEGVDSAGDMVLCI